MLIVEVGFELNEKLDYYDKLLKNNGLENGFNCITHDIYFTCESLDGLSENDIKQRCIRLRSVNDSDYKVQNSFGAVNAKIVAKDNIPIFENEMIAKGYRKVFDTKKKDHHYFKEGMGSKVQLQEIDDSGLLVYFDNEKYYKYDLEEQRRLLIDELNSYGFNLKYEYLGLDKLRTLYYNEKKYSLNQNG